MRVSSTWVIVALLVLTGCEPYLFDMSDQHPLAGQIISPLGTVAPGSRITRIDEGGAVQLSNFGVPEYSLSLGVRVLSGSGAEILIHPRVELNRVVDSGVVATFTRNGASLREGLRVIGNSTSASLDTSSATVVNILTEGHFLQVIVGCDTLYRGKNYGIESDDIVVRTLPSSSIEIVSPNWGYVPGLRR